MNYSFLPYNPIFPKLFEKEKKYFRRIIGKDIVIEHFGSTAVPGLGGKGAIDIYLLVPKDKIQSVFETFQQNGYIFNDYFKDKKDHFLYQIDKKQGNNIYHYNIHLSSIGNKNFKDCIAFRDYLRTHPETIKKYSQIKQIASKKIQGLTDKKEIGKIYMATKESVIQDIIRATKNRKFIGII